MTKITCRICDEPGPFSCERCKMVRYCGQIHQKNDWKSHQIDCNPSTVLEKGSKKIGKHLKAANYLRAGEVIMKEKFLYKSPYSDEDDLVCLACGRIPVKQFPCSKCNWTLCSVECSENIDHLPECNATKKDAYSTFINLNRGKLNYITNKSLYDYIFAIRILTTRLEKAEQWRKVINMKDRNHKRTEEEIRVALKVHENMKTIFNLGDFRFKDIERVIGIFKFNYCFIGESHQIAIYNKTSLISHSCRPNVYISFNDKEEIIVKAAANIPKYKALRRSYVTMTDGILHRQRSLQGLYRFKCDCKRCLDPSDLGTHLNSLTCNYCKKGLVTHPNENQEEWLCTSCKKSNNFEVMEEFVEKMESILPFITTKISCELFLKHSETMVSPFHYTRCAMKIKQIVLNRVEDLVFPEHINEETYLKEKLTVIREVMQYLNVILKGWHLLPGQILRNLLNTLGWTFSNMMDSDKYVHIRKRILTEIDKITGELKKIYVGNSLTVEEKHTLEEAYRYAVIAAHYKEASPE